MDSIMSYSEFIWRIIEGLKEKMGDGYHFTADVSLGNNSKAENFLMIKDVGSPVAPRIPMGPFYSRCIQEGDKIPGLVDEIEDLYRKNMICGSFDTASFTEWGCIRNNIRCCLRNRGMNTAMLSGIPHRDILDLSLTYYTELSLPDGGFGTVHINNRHMDIWNVDENELYRTAVHNMEETKDAVLENITDITGRLMDAGGVGNLIDADRITWMYVLGNKKRAYGAVQILNTGIMEEAAGILGDNFIILPSSIHEVILVPDACARELSYLKQMVKEINETELAPEEILSGHVYRYSRKKGARIAV